MSHYAPHLTHEIYARRRFRSLTDVRLNDPTVQLMTLEQKNLAEIVIQLANEKADLVDRLAAAEAKRPIQIELTAAQAADLTLGRGAIMAIPQPSPAIGPGR